MRRLVLLLTLSALWVVPVRGEPRALTFSERVEAQRAIERVYYSHQTGAHRSFEEAVPQEILEEKVRRYLDESALLEEFWHTPVTAKMLRREWERIAAGTRFPDRLEETYTALGNDPVLIQECFVRPIVVGRLARSFFSGDDRIHAVARKRAEQVRELLARGEPEQAEQIAPRQVIEIVADPIPGGTAEPGGSIAVSRAEFDRLLGELGNRGNPSIGPLHREGHVTENLDSFRVLVLLDEDASSLRVAVYRVPKVSWDTWRMSGKGRWAAAGGAAVSTVAEEVTLAPPAGGQASWCDRDDTWDNGILDVRPANRLDHAAVWTGTHMLVWGGLDYLDGVHPTGWRYDPVTDTWSPMSDAGAPASRRNPTAIWTGREMIVWGGGTRRAVDGTGGRYDPVTDTWGSFSLIGAPSARRYHTAVWTGQEMIIWGGWSDGTDAPNSGGRYDPVTDVWRPVANAASRPRGYHSAVWTGEEMIVWGGYAGGSALNTGGRYKPATDSWTWTPLMNAPSERYAHTAVWTGNEMIVWGGTWSKLTPAGAKFDPVRNAWTPISDQDAPAGRKSLSVVWSGREMIVWGGNPEGSIAVTAEGGRYAPATDTWISTSLDNVPSARGNHTAVWTGELMIVWGGRYQNAWGDYYFPSPGGRYHPATDTWTPTVPTNNNPEGRMLHTAVWTGNEMIVWGGHGYFYLLDMDSGGRYDPLVDVWRPTSISGAPAPRASHTAVWTGDEVIIWGGRGGGSLADGSRYDPLQDTWQPVSPVDAPAGRQDHTAVWTGGEMVIWGGERDFGSLDDGGRYDPATDTWTPTSLVNVPSKRQDHTAVWAGDEMIVWGGRETSDYAAPGLDTGGRYNPKSDTWTPLAVAPFGRHAHSVVWTGEEMIVWGGSAASIINTGSRYDPVTDEWSLVSELGAPSPRGGHAAVWTGQEMIIWGGDPFRDTGGRYDPEKDTWGPTSTAGVPLSRWLPRPVWTGREMIVWGGYSIFGEEGTGGRYIVADLGDADGDGFRVCGGDCDDTRGTVHPAAADLPGNSIDEDCDGENVCDPAAGWRNSGEFVACVARECRRLVEQRTLERSVCQGLIREAAGAGPWVRRGWR